MGRQSKIESSIHFNEIYSRLCEGESARGISEWLKNEYNENISHVSLSKYRNEHIDISKQVEEKINEKLANEEKPLKVEIEDDDTVKDKKRIEEQVINRKTNSYLEREKTTQTVASKTADCMIGVIGVAEDFPRVYRKMVEEAADPESNTSYKDVAKLALEANKVNNDYFNKHDKDLNVNVNNNFNDLFDEDLMSDIIENKRNNK